MDAVNDKPIRTTGNVTTLYLQEDQDPASVGLTDLSYSVGGGSDESASQTLSYALTNLPDSNLGQLGSLSTDTDGNSVFTAITEAGDISLEQLQQLVFNPAANAAGIASFSFSVTDQVGTITDRIDHLKKPSRLISDGDSMTRRSSLSPTMSSSQANWNNGWW